MRTWDSTYLRRDLIKNTQDLNYDREQKQLSRQRQQALLAHPAYLITLFYSQLDLQPFIIFIIDESVSYFLH